MALSEKKRFSNDKYIKMTVKGELDGRQNLGGIAQQIHRKGL